MNFKQDGKKGTFTIDGQIGESSAMFTWKLPVLDELVLDLSEMTSINSIGVKNWIIWTLKIPKTCKVTIENAPFMLSSVASTVIGFLTPNMKLESFKVPYVCESCNHEEIVLIRRGQEYDYPTNDQPKWVKLTPKRPCPKCKTDTMEPDLMELRTFQFLK